MPRKPQAPSITTAQPSLAEDQAKRMRTYLIQMGIRVACFLGAYFVDGWLRWALVAAAVFLPYIAVVGANTGKTNTQDTGNPMEYLQLEAQHEAMLKESENPSHDDEQQEKQQ